MREDKVLFCACFLPCDYSRGFLFYVLILNRKGLVIMKKIKTRTLTVVAILAAAAFLLQMLGSFMQLKVAGFLEIEFSDLPAIIGTMALGPAAGVTIELVKNLLKCMATTTGFIGEFANFVVNGSFVLAAGLVYLRNKTRKGALIAFIIGTVAMTIVALLANIFIMLPLYMPNADFAARFSLALTTITPFNLVKGIVLSIITFFIYKPLSPIIKGK